MVQPEHSNSVQMSDRDLRSFLTAARSGSGGRAAAAAAVVSLDELRSRRGAIPEDVAPPTLSLAQLTGRLVELSAIGATATLTAAVGLVLEAQVAGEPVAWIGLPPTTFYPPDLADSGVDLDALVVVRAPDAVAAARAGERLLRSGAFGLVILDLGASCDISMAHQGRLVSLAQQHDAAIVCITEKATDAASLGSLVSLRVEALRQRADDGFRCTVRALKDKRRGPGWSLSEVLRGPAGLR
jgi:recombination protein RecA